MQLCKNVSANIKEIFGKIYILLGSPNKSFVLPLKKGTTGTWFFHYLMCLIGVCQHIKPEEVQITKVGWELTEGIGRYENRVGSKSEYIARKPHEKSICLQRTKKYDDNRILALIENVADSLTQETPNILALQEKTKLVSPRMRVDTCQVMRDRLTFCSQPMIV